MSRTPPPSRRDALRLIAAGALLPMAAMANGPAASAATTPFTLPVQPQLFARVLRRDLGDGLFLTVTRRFQVRFVVTPEGYVVDGTQVDCTVDAPASLASLAEIERNRVEYGLFPMALDHAGLILTGPEGQQAPSLEQAVAAAETEIARRPLAATEREDVRLALASLQKAAGRISSTVPADLFTPPWAPEVQQREIVLPDGTQGLIATRYSGLPMAGSGLLERAMREILTEVGGNRRLTREEWMLRPLA